MDKMGPKRVKYGQNLIFLAHSAKKFYVLACMDGRRSVTGITGVPTPEPPTGARIYWHVAPINSSILYLTLKEQEIKSKIIQFSFMSSIFVKESNYMSCDDICN